MYNIISAPAHRLKVHTLKGLIIITVINTSHIEADSTAGVIAAAKDDKKLHGQGIGILKATAEKYGGKFFLRSGGGSAQAVFSVLAGN